MNGFLKLIRFPFITWVLLGAAWAYYDYYDWQTIVWDGLQAEHDTANGELAAAVRDAGRIKEFQQQKEKKLAELLSLSGEIEQTRQQYPENPAIPQLLKDLADVADGTGLEFRSFRPQAEVKQEFVTVTPIDVDLKGTYVQIMSFLDSAANLKRAVATEGLTIENPTLRQNSASLITAKARLVTYSVDSSVLVYSNPAAGAGAAAGSGASTTDASAMPAAPAAGAPPPAPPTPPTPDPAVPTPPADPTPPAPTNSGGSA